MHTEKTIYPQLSDALAVESTGSKRQKRVRDAVERVLTALAGKATPCTHSASGAEEATVKGGVRMETQELPESG